MVQGACIPPPQGIVSWWPGDGNTNDLVDHNHGLISGSASFTTGKVDQAFSFDGVNDTVKIPFSPTILSSQFSVDAWVRPSSQVNDPINQEVIFGQSHGAYQLLVRRGVTGLRVAWQFMSSPMIFHQVVSANEIPIGEFTHIAGTWDGTTLKLYLNGALNAQSTPGRTPINSTCPLNIGGFHASPNYPGCIGYPDQQFFNGTIDEVGFHNVALNDLQIQSIYNVGSAGKCKPSLVIQGSPNPGNTITINMSDPIHLNKPYTLATAFGSTPGFNLNDGRNIPLNPDPLLLISLTNPLLIGLNNPQGTFNNGRAIATWTIPTAVPVGLTVYLAFITLNPALPMPQTAVSISPAIPMTII